MNAYSRKYMRVMNQHKSARAKVCEKWRRDRMWCALSKPNLHKSFRLVALLYVFPEGCYLCANSLIPFVQTQENNTYKRAAWRDLCNYGTFNYKNLFIFLLKMSLQQHNNLLSLSGNGFDYLSFTLSFEAVHKPCIKTIQCQTRPLAFRRRRACSYQNRR